MSDTKRQVTHVSLMMTEVHEGKQPAVWIVDPLCRPSPATGWVNDIQDVPGDSDAGQIVLICHTEGAAPDVE